MRIQNSNYSIADISGMIERKELVVNSDYQRNSGFWPKDAKTYFIDTILNDFPFPKVYFYEFLLPQTRKVRREIVDGQQRITTILDYINDGFALTNASLKHRGKRFSDLGDDQNKFLSYSVSTDVILAAERNEILEMFRRMNSYTQPLKPAEKRHSSFNGHFKWLMNELSDQYTPMFVQFGILTQKQIIRMADSELLTEICQLILSGIVNKSDKPLKDLYQNFDAEFPRKVECESLVRETLDFIQANFGDFAGSFLFKSYVFYSLCAALMFNRHGTPILDNQNSTGQFWLNSEVAKNNLRVLISAHETQDEDGPYKEYVNACTSTTHRIAQRQTRAKWLLRALNGTM